MMPMAELTQTLTDTHRMLGEEHAEHIRSAVAERQEIIPDAAQVPPGAPSTDLGLGGDGGAG